ncbi:sporulation protein [Sphingomonas sp. Leaf412]|uniref:SPOR domain-containing protein n=1 Tax=Sphingomonas sp. Leaf412 TaxID=1736370 RepID=UPI0006F87FCA|nr:SPOR domain-containing protein [Sphingomonas sp. Leaf412]KQT33395.1 sporulation protein [Sphingomonas sp. Leaf412]
MKRYLAAVVMAAVTATPAMADVKAGVEAWGRGEFARAVAEWRGPAANGDADAQFNLGQAYKLGRGVAVDQAAATEWFRKAAVQGHPKAVENYGLALFQDGKKAEALPWLEKSVARDEKRSELVLGTMLFNGDAVTRDWTRAYALVTRASQQGLPQGSQTLAQMDRYIPEAQRREGIVLAKRIEADGRTATAGAGTPVGTVPIAPSRVADAASPAATRRSPRVAAAPKPVTVPSAPVAATVAAKPPAPKSVAPRATAAGRWRVQLGAFRDAANARALWSQVGDRVGGAPAYVGAGGLTKLQATGFASRTDAQRACARAGGGCVVVAR